MAAHSLDNEGYAMIRETTGYTQNNKNYVSRSRPPTLCGKLFRTAAGLCVGTAAFALTYGSMLSLIETSTLVAQNYEGATWQQLGLLSSGIVGMVGSAAYIAKQWKEPKEDPRYPLSLPRRVARYLRDIA